jgi:hypothetical protein
MSDWIDVTDNAAPTNRPILVIAKMKRDNDAVTRERRYLFLAKWDALNTQFRPIESPSILDRYVYLPDIEIIHWAEVPQPLPVSVQS